MIFFAKASVYPCRLLWVPDTLLASLQGHNYFHSDTRTLFAFVTIDSGADGIKEMDKTAGALKQIQTVVPSCTHGHYILHCHILAAGEKSQYHIRMMRQEKLLILLS